MIFDIKILIILAELYKRKEKRKEKGEQNKRDVFGVITKTDSPWFPPWFSLSVPPESHHYLVK